MPEQSHQLAAIMFTDIVGYTSLMGRDQAKAMEIVERNRSLQRPIVQKHSGKWHKDLGDGSLVSFQSAIEAVNCALEIQKAVAGEDELKLRIGIHLGDVTFKETDVYGDGVNIASRIESITDPGGIEVAYYACDEDDKWCKLVVQNYTLTLERDPYAGGVIGRSFRGRPPQGMLTLDRGNMVDRMMSFDTDQNGLLSKDELPERMQIRFDMMDANNDGYVSKEELLAIRRR